MATADVAVGDMVEVRTDAGGRGRTARCIRGEVLALNGRRALLQLPHWREEFDVARCRVIKRAKPAEEAEDMRGVRTEIEPGTLRRFAELYNGGEKPAAIKETLDLTQIAYRRYFQEAKRTKMIEAKAPMQIVASESWEEAAAGPAEPDPGEPPAAAIESAPVEDPDAAGNEPSDAPVPESDTVVTDETAAIDPSPEASEEEAPAHPDPTFEYMPNPIDWRERCRQEYARAETRLECARRAEEATEAMSRIYGAGADELFRAIWYQYLREMQDLDVAG